ncbi:MAG: hypothetical protein AB7I19_02335 [Planctomycetota bacterium]
MQRLLRGRSVRCLIVALLLCVAGLRAQESPPPTGRQSQAAALREIADSLTTVTGEIQLQRNALEQLPAGADRASAQAALDSLERRRDELFLNLDSLATGLDLEVLSGVAAAQRPLLERLEELLHPLLQRIQDATAVPRRLEELRAIAQVQEQRVETLERGLTRMRATRDALAADDPLISWLDQRIARVVGEVAESRRKASIARGQYDNLSSDRRPFLELAGDGVRDFLAGRGLNLLLALATLIGVFLLSRVLYRPLERLLSRHHGARPAYLRLVSVIVHVLAGAVAILSALVLLWARGDWLLLAVSILILLGTAIVGREALPRHLAEIRLLLNLGPVREGERLVYEGVPYVVDGLGVRARLVNRHLDGGVLHLAPSSLLGMQSRPAADGEPTFPCVRGDFVSLDDETKGIVRLQTPEIVRLELPGGGVKTYPTPAFLAQNPINHASGMLVKTTFGLDYRLQKDATTEIPLAMATEVQRRLKERFGDEAIQKVVVEFANAGSSSLDLDVLVMLAGKNAADAPVVRRMIQRVLVELCTARNWNIPFPQLVVHRT